MAPHDHMITLERFPEIFYAVQAFKPKEGAGAVGRAASVPLHYQANQELREAFEQFGASLTHTAFTKLVMDCGLTDFVRVTNQVGLPKKEWGRVAVAVDGLAGYLAAIDRK